jgi:thiol-disulfide isomerase/thioredoxin
LFLLAANVAPIAMANAQDVQRVNAGTIENTVLISENGRSVRLSDYRGKVVFVNFWGSWCTPCLQEMASIRNLQARLGGRGDVVFAFVSAKTSQFQQDTAWLRQNGVAGANYRSASGAPGLSVPTTFILDQSGAVALFRNTAIDWEIHSDLIRNLVSRGWRQASN